MNQSTGLVHGTIRLKLLSSDGMVQVGLDNGLLDTYNFDQQLGRPLRNAATALGAFVAGNGSDYQIRYYGKGQLVDVKNK